MLKHRSHCRCTLKLCIVGRHYLLEQSRGVALADGEADKRQSQIAVPYLTAISDGNPLLRFLSGECPQHVPSHVTHTG